MFFSNLNSDFKSKTNTEYIQNCKVVSEYAYSEDINSRMTMEDGFFYLIINQILNYSLQRSFCI